VFLLGYRRTVLVIWPEEHYDEVITGDPLDALDNLRATDSQEPDSFERDQADYFLRAIRGGRLDRSAVANTVCTAACTWRDLRLWKRAVLDSGADSKAFMLENECFQEADFWVLRSTASVSTRA